MSVLSDLKRVGRTRASTMQAAQLVEPGRFEIVEAAMPDPGPGQVRIQLQGCGVCASNVPPFEGRDWFSYPMEPGALGHEGWGYIDAIAEGVKGLKEGDRVAFLGQHSYAEYDVCSASAVVEAPNNLSDFPGEPLGCCMNIFARSGIKKGDKVAIVGIGFLGALLTQLAAKEGAEVIAVARKPYALQVAKQFGAKHLVTMDDHTRIIQEVSDLTGGVFCDVVIEATGKPWPLDVSAELTKERGRLVVAGFHQDGPRHINMFLWNWRGLDVINAHEREEAVYIQGIGAAMDAVSDGSLTPESLYTHKMGLHQLTEALTLTKERPDGFMKALISMES